MQMLGINDNICECALKILTATVNCKCLHAASALFKARLLVQAVQHSEQLTVVSTTNSIMRLMGSHMTIDGYGAQTARASKLLVLTLAWLVRNAKEEGADFADCSQIMEFLAMHSSPGMFTHGGSERHFRERQWNLSSRVATCIKEFGSIANGMVIDFLKRSR